MKSKSFSLNLAGKNLTAEFTDLAGQTNGSVLLRYDETAILVTAVMNSEPNTQADYFPLSVEFEEKFYAAGAILGSRFMRREGRPSDEAILSARIVDRTIRPLFDSATRNDVQIVITVLAIGEEDPDVLGIIGTSLALAVSDIPWRGPVGAVRIGRNRKSGEIILNPTYTERAKNLLDFEILACGKNGTVNMIETAADEVSEQDIMSVLEAAVEIHKQLEEWQKNIIAEVGKQKNDKDEEKAPLSITELFNSNFATKLHETIFSNQAGKTHIQKVKKGFLSAAIKGELDTTVASSYFEKQINKMLHHGAIEENLRADGRDFNQVRPLFAKAGGVSPVLHGSGIFYRGETHIFSALTLGGRGAAQLLDTIESHNTKKSFMHHYNFPPFSVGETGRIGGFNRRMIGHGALAEKALAPVIPAQESFPYTIRLVSETMSCNGSSSMGSVCASTLALLDGGVPIKKPVAGIAIGAMIQGDKYKLLTDIQGPEDEFGDMDFKIAGTSEGVTAMQMDIKTDGISLQILREAFEQAREARAQILETIQAEIPSPRATISDRAPQIVSLKINPNQIGLVVGSKGKTVKKIKEETHIEEIDFEDDGTIYLSGLRTNVEAAAHIIESLTKEYEAGESAVASITKITNFGAFAKINEHVEGLIHISEIAPFRVENIRQLLQVGDEVKVVVTKVEDGKIGLSIKEADPDRFSTFAPEQ